MPTHSDTCVLPYRANFLCDLVADIEKYPEFLPWCRGVRILENDGNDVKAEVTLGNDFVTESYRCLVKTDYPYRIDVVYVDGPFKYLNTHWRFIECDDGTNECKVDFFIDFEFQSSLFQMLFQKMFASVVESIMAAFKERAHVLHQQSTAGATNP